MLKASKFSFHGNKLAQLACDNTKPKIKKITPSQHGSLAR